MNWSHVADVDDVHSWFTVSCVESFFELYPMLMIQCDMILTNSHFYREIWVQTRFKWCHCCLFALEILIDFLMHSCLDKLIDVQDFVEPHKFILWPTKNRCFHLDNIWNCIIYGTCLNDVDIRWAQWDSWLISNNHITRYIVIVAKPLNPWVAAIRHFCGYS